MSYTVADLHPGDIILCASTGSLLDRVISWSQGPFDHTALVGDGHLVEQAWTVRDTPLDEYAANGWAYRVDATAEQRTAAVGWSESRLGQRYGVREILLDAARFDLHLWPRRVAPLKRWTCSAFVVAAYAAAGLTLTHAPYPSPVDLACSPLLIGTRPWE